MGNIQKPDRVRRHYVVRELYLLGLSASQIAPTTGWSQPTIALDIRTLGGVKAFPNRPMRRGEILKVAVERYAQLITESSRDDSVVSEDKDTLRLALAQWLQEEKILVAITGIISSLARLVRPSFSVDNKARARLLGAILSIKVGDSCDEPLSFLPSSKELWREYLGAIGSDKESVPQSFDQLVSALSRFVLDEHRARIMPIWGEEVFARVDAMLAALDERQRKVICERFGIGTDKAKTFEQIAPELGVTRERVRQLEARAMSNLRLAAQKLNMGVIGDPIGNAVEQEMARRKAAESEAAQRATTAELDMVQEFLREVQELELSVRTANCLQNADILLIGELVQWIPTDLLCTKNFGRKSLCEINEVLDELGLKLEMKLSDLVKAQIARRREEILAKRQNH